MFRQPHFWIVFVAFVLTNASNVLTIYALSFFLLEQYVNNPELLSIAELMNTLPIIAGFLLIGIFTDRFHRKHLALVSLAVRFLLAAALTILISSGWLTLVFALLFLRTFFHKLFSTMEMAIIQGLLQSREFITFSSLKQLVNGVLAMSGSFIALFIYQSFGIVGVMAVDAGFTVCSLVFMWFAKIPLSSSLPNGRMQFSLGFAKPFIQDIKEGFTYAWSRQILRTFLFTFMVFGVVNAVLATLPLYSIRYTLAPDVETYRQYSVIFSFLLGLSFVIGSLSSPLWVKHLNARRTILFSALTISILVTLLGFIQLPWLFFADVFVFGVVIVMLNIVIGASIPQAVSPSFMGRMYSLLDPASLATKSLGLFVIGFLFKHVSLAALYLIMGLLLLIGASVIWRLLKNTAHAYPSPNQSEGSVLQS